MKGKDLQPRLLYLAKLSFKMEGQIKCFQDKVKLKEFIITKPLLYEMLQGFIQEKEIENLFEKIMKENFPNLTKEIDFQEAQRFPKKLDSRRNTARHIIITLAKIKQKERILKAAREKVTVTYKGMPISAVFSKQTLQARMGWKEVFQVMKGKDLHPRLLHPAKLSFRTEGQITCFPDNIKLKEFIITEPLLYEMLK